MLFSQARQFASESKGYTMENAHDHVQAIRLMRFESGDQSDLRTLVSKYKSFDEAHSYLRRLARTQPDRVSINAFYWWS